MAIKVAKLYVELSGWTSASTVLEMAKPYVEPSGCATAHTVVVLAMFYGADVLFADCVWHVHHAGRVHHAAISSFLVQFLLQ